LVLKNIQVKEPVFHPQNYFFFRFLKQISFTLISNQHKKNIFRNHSNLFIAKFISVTPFWYK
jgi:hypothetical protein